MLWQIVFYSDEVETEIEAMSADLVARFAHFIELLKLFGPALREPHTKALGDGLFEARLKGKETIARVFFAYEKGRIVIMLHGFIKKSQKTPLRELAVARERHAKVRQKDEKRR